jgi:hypothetical protein
VAGRLADQMGRPAVVFSTTIDPWLSREYARLLDELFSAARTGAQFSGN